MTGFWGRVEESAISAVWPGPAGEWEVTAGEPGRHVRLTNPMPSFTP